MSDMVFDRELERESFSRLAGRIVWQRQFEPRPLELTCEFFDFRYRCAGRAESYLHLSPPLNRLFAVTQGRIAVECRRRRYEVEAGETLLLPALLPFRAEYPADSAMLFLHFSLADRIGYWLFSHRNEPVTTPTHPCFPRPEPTDGTGATEWDGEIENRLWLCIYDLITPEEWENVFRHCRLSPQMAELFRLLESTPPAMARVKELAAALGVSPLTLARRFRHEFKRPIKEFLTERLARRTLRLLSDGDQTLNTIAERLGFADSGYFHRFFRRRFGRTPGEWRRSNG